MTICEKYAPVSKFPHEIFPLLRWVMHETRWNEEEQRLHEHSANKSPLHSSAQSSSLSNHRLTVSTLTSGSDDCKAPLGTEDLCHADGRAADDSTATTSPDGANASGSYSSRDNVISCTSSAVVDGLHTSTYGTVITYFSEGSQYVLQTVQLNYWRLLGTAGAWFILDVVFYANGLFSGQVIVCIQQLLQWKPHELHMLSTISVQFRLYIPYKVGICIRIFGTIRVQVTEAMRFAHSPRSEAAAALVLQSIALPGYICTILYADRIGLRRLQLCGFAATALIFLVLAALQSYLVQVPAVYVFVYGLTFFAQNFGANSTTYIIPSLLFSAAHRATCHGISAAAGKLGALFGAQVSTSIIPMHITPSLLQECAS